MHSANYWEDETPVIERTEHNVFRWYVQAGRLQVSTPDYEGKYGRTMAGKTVGIFVGDVQENDAVKAMLRKVFQL